MRVDLVGDHRVAVIGVGEKAAEFLFRIIMRDGEQDFALVDDEDRLVVGDEFGEQRQAEQREENPQRPQPALIAP